MICVAVVVEMLASFVPNFTAVAPVTFVPVIVTLVPPAATPLVGRMPVTVGADVASVMVPRTRFVSEKPV